MNSLGALRCPHLGELSLSERANSSDASTNNPLVLSNLACIKPAYRLSPSWRGSPHHAKRVGPLVLSTLSLGTLEAIANWPRCLLKRATFVE
jgi:hypothetical protein